MRIIFESRPEIVKTFDTRGDEFSISSIFRNITPFVSDCGEETEFMVYPFAVMNEYPSSWD